MRGTLFSVLLCAVALLLIVDSQTPAQVGRPGGKAAILPQQDLEACNNGNCGACNVILDGRLVNSCLVLAVEVQDRSVTTIEGVATPEGLHPLQQKFLEQAALQCGVCTPGFIVAARALLEKNPKPNEHEVRHWLAGNLCRC